VAGQLCLESDELVLALRNGEHAMACGDSGGARNWFTVAYQLAEERGDAAALAAAALGLGGPWVYSERTAVGSIVQRSRLRQALQSCPADSPLARRLRARLAAETGYGDDAGAALLALLREAEGAGDHAGTIELLHLAHHCLLAPEHSALRHELAHRLITAAARGGSPADQARGLLWRTVDLILDGDPQAKQALSELSRIPGAGRHRTVDYALQAIGVMYQIRAGRLDQAEAGAKRCAGLGQAIGDPHAPSWYATHLMAVRWFQGRMDETLTDLLELASAEVGVVEQAFTAALAVGAASAGDHRQAAAALARLGDGDLSRIRHTSTWLICLYAAVEAAAVLGDTETTRAAYPLLLPFADLPVTASLGIVCLGSVRYGLGAACLTLGDTATAVTHLRAALRANLALEHWPAVTLTRWRLAIALDRAGPAHHRAEIASLRATARREAAEFGIRLPDPEPAPSSARVAMRRRGQRWEMTLGTSTVLVADCRGLRYLAVLTANADRDIPATTLVSGALAGEWDRGGHSHAAQPVLDDAARSQYRRRLSELTAQIEASDAAADAARSERLAQEREWLLRELAAASGLGGRAKAFLTDEERARVAVGKAIRRAIGNIGRSDPLLREHLHRRVRTGRYCVYLSEP
jgi:hypothetical protein